MLQGRQLDSYMSDSKWVKLLEALSKVEGLVKIAKVKLVWDNEFRDINIDETVKYNFDIYDHTMNSMIQGYPTGFYEFIEIEWLEFPAESQDISLQKLKRHLSLMMNWDE